MFIAEALIREVAIEGIFNVAGKTPTGKLDFSGNSVHQERLFS